MSITSDQYPRRGFLARVAALPVFASIISSWRPSWSMAQVAAEELLTVSPMPEADLAREVESLMRFVSPRVAYRHAPIAPERNAWPYWRQAMAALVEEDKDVDYEDAVDAFLERGERPADAVLARMAEWVRQNEPARRLTDEGIARGEFELPRATESIRLKFTPGECMGLRDLARIKEYVVELANLEGDVAKALREAMSIIRMSGMMLRSECLYVDYLVAHAVFGIGASAATSAALSKHATVEQAKMAINALAEFEPDDRYFRQAVRVEFCRWLLPMIAEATDGNDAHALAKCFVMGDRVNLAELSDLQAEEYARCIHDLTAVLAGHPRLFDREATARLASELHEGLFDEFDRPCLERSHDLLAALRSELAAWPAHVEPDFWVLASLGKNPAAVKKPTQAELRNLRGELRRVENLVGKRMVYDSLYLMRVDGVEMHLARTTARMLCIAMAHFERQHGELPGSLDQLVDDGWFSSVPLDPYDLQPFRYSAADRILWSVGPEGAGDGPSLLRSEQLEPGWEHLKSVWRIPRAPAV